MNLEYINVVGYVFEPIIQDRKKLRECLKDFGLSCNLKGTLLIAPEGINVTSVSGKSDQVWKFLDYLSQITGISCERFDFKQSQCVDKPFSRFLVRLKKEIISFDDTYQVEQQAPYVSGCELDRMLEDRQDVVLLDTRNDYEIELGSFKNAIKPPIKTFKEFKSYVDSIENLKDKKVVTFCTGGIRCEKAATYLKRRGFSDVYQLHGGILRYFETTDAKNYDGECFVFDKRVSLKKDLCASDKKLCYACRSTLMPEDMKSPLYISGQSCPHCYDKDNLEHAS